MEYTSGTVSKPQLSVHFFKSCHDDAVFSSNSTLTKICNDDDNEVVTMAIMAMAVVMIIDGNDDKNDNVGHEDNDDEGDSVGIMKMMSLIMESGIRKMTLAVVVIEIIFNEH